MTSEGVRGVRSTAVLKDELGESVSAPLATPLPLRRLPQKKLMQRLRSRFLRPDEVPGESATLLTQLAARWAQGCSLVELGVSHSFRPVNVEGSPQEVRVCCVQLGLQRLRHRPSHCVVEQDCFHGCREQSYSQIIITVMVKEATRGTRILDNILVSTCLSSKYVGPPLGGRTIT